MTTRPRRLSIFSIFCNMKVCSVFSLESPHRGDSNEYVQYTIFNIKKENHPKLSQICSYVFFFQRSQEQVRNSRGKRTSSVRATKLFYFRTGNSYDFRCTNLDFYDIFANYSQLSVSHSPYSFKTTDILK